MLGNAVNPLDFVCPYCGALKGQWCKDFRGGLSVRIHKKRHAIATRMKDDPKEPAS